MIRTEKLTAVELELLRVAKIVHDDSINAVERSFRQRIDSITKAHGCGSTDHVTFKDAEDGSIDMFIEPLDAD